MYNFVYKMYKKKVFFDDFLLFMPEQIAVAEVKKNRRNLRKSWLGQLDSNQ